MTILRSLDAMLFAHPRSVGESYGQHFRIALTFGVRMFAGACAALIHALLPFLFQKTAGDVVRRLHAQLEHRTSARQGSDDVHRVQQRAVTAGG